MWLVRLDQKGVFPDNSLYVVDICTFAYFLFCIIQVSNWGFVLPTNKKLPEYPQSSKLTTTEEYSGNVWEPIGVLVNFDVFPS